MNRNKTTKSAKKVKFASATEPVKTKKIDESVAAVYRLICGELYVPMKKKEIAIMLQVAKEDRLRLDSALEILVRKKMVEITKRGKYIKAVEAVVEKKIENSSKEYVGIFYPQRAGHAFVKVEGFEKDFYVGSNHTKNSFFGDTVKIVVIEKAIHKKVVKKSTYRSRGNSAREGRIEAKVIEIIERKYTHLIGEFQMHKEFGFVLPDKSQITEDIYIPLPRSKGAKTGDKVLVKLTSYGGLNKSPEGIIVENFGDSDRPDVAIRALEAEYDLPKEFSEKVLNQAQRVAKPVSEADCANRVDLREEMMITIDGADAKDLDDAVSVKYEGGFYELGVHIADVTNYVQENSALDYEAIERGTSIYLVDHVIPMLPRSLSNGICSLNEKEDRLALSCIMRINNEGKIVEYDIVESVICTNHRMTYKNVSKIVEGDVELREKYSDIYDMIINMDKLSSLLRKVRERRGAIDFDLPESCFILGEDGIPTDIYPYDRNIASKIIEDFMLAANETVAEYFYNLKIPFVYRIHEVPAVEKIEKLEQIINKLGYFIRGTKNEIFPKNIQKIINDSKGKDEELLVARNTLRSMQQARYATECKGHFGLACTYYSHFTSPIRRYPDLQIHRIIKETLRGKMTKERQEHYSEILGNIATKSSTMERRAVEAERELHKVKKIQFINQHVGEVYEGVVSSIVSWGMYVELDNTVEGFVSIHDIGNDRCIYDEKEQKLYANRGQDSWKIGQRVTIEVKAVDIYKRNIDFRLL